FGPDRLKALPRPYVYSREGGIHPNVAAELLGFRSGEELLTALEIAEPMDQYIDRLTDERMREEHGDMESDGRLAEEAMRAFHNEKRAQMLRMELEHIMTNAPAVMKDAIRRVARRVPSERAVRQQAERTIGGRTMQMIRPQVFLRAEIRAAREAGQA